MGISDDEIPIRPLYLRGDGWKQALSDQMLLDFLHLGSGLEYTPSIYLYPLGSFHAELGK